MHETSVDEEDNVITFMQQMIPHHENAINIKNSSIAAIVEQHVNGKGIVPKPFDVSFLDAFDHTISLVLSDTYMKNNWQEILEQKWK